MVVWRIAHFALRISLLLLGLALLAVLVVVVVGGESIRAVHAAPAHKLVIPGDPQTITEGKRLAAIRGCTGCHGVDGGGRIFFQTPLGDRVVATNLTRIVRDYDVIQLESAIRHGLRPNGRALAGMPARMFSMLSDRDLASIIAFLRTLPPVRDTLPATRLGLLASYFLLRGELYLDADSIDHTRMHAVEPPADGMDQSAA